MLVIVAFSSVSTLGAANAAAISQSFQTNDNGLVTGALASLKTNSSNTVELANQDRVTQLVGVIGNNALIEFGATSSSVQVVTSGVTTALVSDVNGDVKTGDKITASPVDGVGMKATSSTVVVGTAQADLSSVQTKTRDITDKSGQTQTVKIGQIPVQVNVTFYAPPDQQQTVVPSFLQDFANGVAGKEVSPVRVLISATIMLLAFVSIAVLLYASVKSSIISIGRNPLSERSVRKSLFQIGLFVLMILLLTLITIYLILTT